MSKSEFDQYLALLSGLLRLNPAQREAIASELRDHLEERLTELLAQGVSRQQAIETALEEFGDATGLAGEFVQIFQRQRRRRMMRMTFGAATGISAILLLTTAFWPEGRPGPSPQRLVAQTKKSNRASIEAPMFAAARHDANSQIEANLRLRIDVDYIELPFAEVLDELEVQAGVQFYIKTKYLEDLGIPTDFPITISLDDVSVETALELILETADLTYIIRDGVILITTEEDVESVAEVRVYNCRDLLEDVVEPFQGVGGAYLEDVPGEDPAALQQSEHDDGAARGKKRRAKPEDAADQSSFFWNSASVLAQFGGGMGGGGGGMAAMQQGPESREDQLMNIITIAVSPESWEDMGGPGTIGEFNGMIVIRHNPRAHRKVEQVLQMLRDAARQQFWSNPDGRRRDSTPGGFGGGGGGFF